MIGIIFASFLWYLGMPTWIYALWLIIIFCSFFDKED